MLYEFSTKPNLVITYYGGYDSKVDNWKNQGEKEVSALLSKTLSLIS
jgi:hypothetical protein